MKKNIFIIVLGVVFWVFTACEDEQPGYLFSSEADYPIDSLVVQTPALQQRILTEKIDIRENFAQTEEGRLLYQQKEKLQQEFEELSVTIDELNMKSYELEDLLYYSDPPLSDEEFDRVAAEYYQVIDDLQAAQNNRADVNKQKKEVEEKIELMIGNIDAEIVLLQRRLDKRVAYSTSVIDKMQGTAPLIYSIAHIETQGAGDVGKFAGYVTVMGGGRFIVNWDDNIPVGRYVISLYVENEGWKDLLPDIFTIIVVDK